MADPSQRSGTGPVPAGPPNFTLRPPQPQAPPAPSPSPAPPPPAPAPAPAPSVAIVPPGPPTSQFLVGGLTQNGALIGGAIVLVLAIVFLFLRGAVRSHLIANKAPLSAAGGAGWALFAFLLTVSVTIVFGLLGQFWTVLSFIVPLGVLCAITLLLFILLFNSATRIRR